MAAARPAWTKRWIFSTKGYKFEGQSKVGDEIGIKIKFKIVKVRAGAWSQWTWVKIDDPTLASNLIKGSE